MDNKAKNYKIPINRTNINKMLLEATKQLNFETELIPYLSEEEKLVFENHVLRPNISGLVKFQREHKLSSSVAYITSAILRKINIIIKKKQAIKTFEDRYGGRESLDDLAMMLLPHHREILYGYILNIDPKAAMKMSQKISKKESLFMRIAHDEIPVRLDVLYKRKLESEAFIKKYGGEDFILHDFLPALERTSLDIERDEAVLTTLLMDYHYNSELDLENKLTNGEKQMNLYNVKNAIIQKLDNYIKRKKEIDELLDRIDVNKFNEYIASLNAIKKTILMESVIAYAPLNTTKLASLLNSYSLKVEKLQNQVANEVNKLAQIDKPKKCKN